ncbi:hypothetical protein [Rheinheimera aquimaris]|uniref:hypothetical protein n=1 Tax=Rheinheimera aquimaris TaxID=412437 RepID=UPI001E37AC13|nr:hypothetical protein [Rheinheimera aquimaris]MCD1598991.1 hypothetical protein [Rheinheimera aquimaris]
MKFIGYISALALLAGTAQAQTNPVITPGSGVLASLVAQHQNQASLATADIVAASQGGTGYQLTGELLLQLATSADINTVLAQYNLQLKQRFGNILVVNSDNANLSQLRMQLQADTAVAKVSYDLRELGLSPDPEVINEPK